MKYYLIAGEPSGDLHGSNLIKGLLKADPEARLRFWGGDLMDGLDEDLDHFFNQLMDEHC